MAWRPGVLARITSPLDLRSLGRRELDALAGEIRDFLVEKVTATGGHLGSNLGVVELTIALHRVFDSPRDAVIFDAGHQAYVHKILTGRAAAFGTLRRSGGLSGYPNRSESDHDWVESSHSSSALSYADGLAKAFALRGQSHRRVVAVVGDGALTGGMCWEALNNIAAADRPVIVVLNDNGRTHAPTVGALARRLAQVRSQDRYLRMVRTVHARTRDVPVLGARLSAALQAVTAGMRDLLGAPALFEDLGLTYLGPVDGHDRAAVEAMLRRAVAVGGPVVVHAVTRKGHGYRPAERHATDRMHSCEPIDAATAGDTKSAAGHQDWTTVWTAELIRQARHRPDLVAVTAAMAGPTGLDRFGARYPERLFDVGKAEQHAVTSAAGLALGGLHPVVAIHSAFLNRAFDQILMDVALLRQPVTFVLDQAGVTGPDGASHNGVWDLSMLGIVPGMRVAAPRDAVTLREELREALAVADGPTALRFPKGVAASDISALERIDGVDVLWRPPHGSGAVLLVSVGPFAAQAVAAARALADHGVTVTVVDPRWVLPVPETLVKLAEDVELVVTVEDGCLHGGVGAALAARLRAIGNDVPHREIGVPQRFLEHGSRAELHIELGLTAADVARRITGWLHDGPEELRCQEEDNGR